MRALRLAGSLPGGQQRGAETALAAAPPPPGPGSPHPRSLARLLLLRLAARLGRVEPARPPAPEDLRVLLLRPDHLGDVLLTSPAVALLEAALPRAHLTYLVGPWSADLARHGPLARCIESLPFPGFTRRRSRNPLAPYLLLWREAARLRAGGYHAAVVFRPDHWWGALLALVAGVPLRLGFDLPETHPLLTHRLPRATDRHAAEQALALARQTVAVLGVAAPTTAPARPLVFSIRAEEDAAAARLLAGHHLGQRPVAALHPSAGVRLKSWPLERWAALANALAAEGFTVLLSGGPGDATLLDRVGESMAAPPAAVVQGQPIGVVAAVFRRCSVVVGPDNGPLHLAAAVGTSTVRLYGPASAALFGPWPPGPTQRALVTGLLPCVPCGDLVQPPCGARHVPPCMLAHSVEDVVSAVHSVSRPPA